MTVYVKCVVRFNVHKTLYSINVTKVKPELSIENKMLDNLTFRLALFLFLSIFLPCH